LGQLTSYVRSSNAPAGARRAVELYGLLALSAVAVLYAAAWVLRRPLRLALAITYTLATLYEFGLFT
jgi:CHASE2 domain-containing sensor protein